MTEIFILFYLIFEFVLLVLWMPKLIRISDNSWVRLKQVKIPLLILLSFCLLGQVYIVVTQNEVKPLEKHFLLVLGEFLVKIGFIVIIVTRIMVSISFLEMDVRRIQKADLILTYSALISIVGFLIRNVIIFS